MSRTAGILIAILVLLWIGGVGLWTVDAWPRLPLDVPARDPAIAALHQRAVSAHLFRAVAMAALPLVLLGVVVLAARRRRGGR